MIKSTLISALITGAFCAAFVMGFRWATDWVDSTSILWFSCAGAFLGSLFARSVLSRWGGQD